MTSWSISLLVFVCGFGGALLGAILRRRLPEHHLGADSKEIVRLGTGLVGTMTALVLGLLVASAKSSYDGQKSEVITLSSKIIFLDRILANYGAEAGTARELLRRQTVAALARIWPARDGAQVELAPLPSNDKSLFATLVRLEPADEGQKQLKSQALGLASEIGQMRWLMYEQSGTSISSPFLVVLILWLTVMFISFGVFAPINTMVVSTLLICALSVACAIFLILELDHPFEGLICISSDPLQFALANMGQ